MQKIPYSLCCLIACIAFFDHSHAQPVGNWQGTLKMGFLELNTILIIDDSLAAEFSIPDQMAYELPGRVSYQNDSVELSIKNPPIIFRAAYRTDTLDGVFIQGKQAIPLVLTRSDTMIALYPPRPQTPRPPFPYEIDSVRFRNKKAKIELAGTLTLPRGKGPFPAMVLISGSGPQDRDETLFEHRPFAVLADRLTRSGVAVLRFDERGVGQSEGSFGGSTSEDFASDVWAAVRSLKKEKRIDDDKIGLLGHSEGGAIAPMLAVAEPRDIAFVVMLAGPALPGSEILQQQALDILKMNNASEGLTELQMRLMRTTHGYIYHLDSLDRLPAGASLSRPLRRLLEEQIQPEDSAMFEALGGERTLDAFVKSASDPWMRYFVTYDPRPTLRKLQVPVLALYGQKDLQVSWRENALSAEAAFREGNHPHYTVFAFPNLNHLFQPARSGLVQEYARIETTIDESVLDRVVNWVIEVVD